MPSAFPGHHRSLLADEVGVEGASLRLDYAHRGTGNASCGPRPMTKYDLNTEPTAFDFLIFPLRQEYTTDELVAKARLSVPER